MHSSRFWRKALTDYATWAWAQRGTQLRGSVPWELQSPSAAWSIPSHSLRKQCFLLLCFWGRDSLCVYTCTRTTYTYTILAWNSHNFTCLCLQGAVIKGVLSIPKGNTSLKVRYTLCSRSFSSQEWTFTKIWMWALLRSLYSARKHNTVTLTWIYDLTYTMNVMHAEVCSVLNDLPKHHHDSDDSACRTVLRWNAKKNRLVSSIFCRETDITVIAVNAFTVPKFWRKLNQRNPAGSWDSEELEVQAGTSKERSQSEMEGTVEMQ